MKKQDEELVIMIEVLPVCFMPQEYQPQRSFICPRAKIIQMKGFYEYAVLCHPPASKTERR